MSSGTIVTILIIAVLAVVAFITIKNYRKKLNEGCCGAGGDEGPGETVRPADPDESHYPHEAAVLIEGMHCENCVTRVQNALNRIDGVMAKVDLSSNSARVLLKDEKLAAQVRMAVANNGYAVKEYTAVR